ncbi:MAG TPA: GDSL-type esterase/lipase family protein [Paludibaculum sp.]|jgi:lysophospholipase L1-like esterase
MWKLSVLALFAIVAPAQQPQVAPLSDPQALVLYERCLQLIEASGVASAELGRASLPLAENMRQSVDSLKFLGMRNPQLHYRYMMNLRAFLLLSDTLPRPATFPEMAKQQLAELRDSLLRIEIYYQRQIEQLQNDLRSPDRDALKRYAAANVQLPPPAAKSARIVFYGDSITDFWRLNEYFPGRDFVNRGISGQITGQMLGRFYADVVALKPAAFLLLAGTNDIARGVDPAAIQNNILMMCDLADTYKIRVILAGILPVSDHHKGANASYERTRQRPIPAILDMNKWIQAFCEKRGYTYLNYYPAMAGADGQLAPNLADDGLHPNPTGYRIMAPLALAAIEKALGPPSPQPGAKKRRLF